MVLFLTARSRKTMGSMFFVTMGAALTLMASHPATAQARQARPVQSGAGGRGRVVQPGFGGGRAGAPSGSFGGGRAGMAPSGGFGGQAGVGVFSGQSGVGGFGGQGGHPVLPGGGHPSLGQGGNSSLGQGGFNQGSASRNRFQPMPRQTTSPGNRSLQPMPRRPAGSGNRRGF